MPTSSNPGLEVTTTDDAVVVRFVDQQILNGHKMEAIGEELTRLADELGGRAMRLDFDNVLYIQSSVLGKLVSLHKKVTGAGGSLVLCNIHNDAYKVFAVTKLDGLFVIERSNREPTRQKKST